jgi:nucleoid-associated protein YgaU
MFVRFILVAFLVTVLAWSVLARGSEGAGAGRPYRVEPGDTLWSIAVRHYGGDPREAIWRLERENGLTGSTLVPGQVVRVP